MGAAIAKVPVISKGPVDEALIAAGEKLEERNTVRIDGALGRLIEVMENYKLLTQKTHSDAVGLG